MSCLYVLQYVVLICCAYLSCLHVCSAFFSDFGASLFTMFQVQTQTPNPKNQNQNPFHAHDIRNLVGRNPPPKKNETVAQVVSGDSWASAVSRSMFRDDGQVLYLLYLVLYLHVP